jgi:3-oxoacyl-[acyl-carrier protein] reductase
VERGVTRGLAGQAAIVTGGARGIGLGIAQRLVAEGCRVALWDRSFDGFDLVRERVPDALTQVVDVADHAAVVEAFRITEATFGDVRILVNNAGINGPVAPVWEYPPDAWERVLAIDLTAVFYCTRVVVPHMTARRYGRIVNIASIAGKEGNERIAAYAAAKAGVIGFTKSVARELVDTGVLVNALAPALTETALFREMTPEHIALARSRIPMKRPVQIPEVAAIVAWMASPECSFNTGFTFDLTGGRATY